jgi:hypothetical protein
MKKEVLLQEEIGEWGRKWVFKRIKVSHIGYSTKMVSLLGLFRLLLAISLGFIPAISARKIQHNQRTIQHLHLDDALAKEEAMSTTVTVPAAAHMPTRALAPILPSDAKGERKFCVKRTGFLHKNICMISKSATSEVEVDPGEHTIPHPNVVAEPADSDDVVVCKKCLLVGGSKFCPKSATCLNPKSGLLGRGRRCPEGVGKSIKSLKECEKLRPNEHTTLSSITL